MKTLHFSPKVNDWAVCSSPDNCDYGNSAPHHSEEELSGMSAKEYLDNTKNAIDQAGKDSSEFIDPPVQLLGQKKAEQVVNIQMIAEKQAVIDAKSIPNDTPITEEVIDDVMEKYGLTEYEEPEENEDGSFSFNYYESHVLFNVETGRTAGSMRESLADELESFDLDSYYEEHDHGVEHLKGFDDSAGEINDTANKIRADLGKNSLEYNTLDNRIQEASHNAQPVSSDVGNDSDLKDENIEGLIEDYDLDHGNAEFSEDKDDAVLTLTVEAPNHATSVVHHNLDSSRNTSGDLREGMIESMREFDANEEFDALWSSGFGRHNGFTPSEFYVQLTADEEYFKSRADDIEKDLNS